MGHLSRIVTIGILAALVSPAFAGLYGHGLTITAVDQGGASASLTLDGVWVGDTFVWSSNERMEFRNGDDTLAVLNPNQEGSSFYYHVDPVVNLNFALQAGASTTTFMVSSALLSFPDIALASAVASASFSVTDSNGNGAALASLHPSGAYLAQYNGFAGTESGTTYTRLLTGVSAGAFASNTVADSYPATGFVGLAGPISDISSAVGFTLSAHDLASGTTTFTVEPVPAPGAALLALVGFGLLRSRRG
jgi:hypothetical protein